MTRKACKEARASRKEDDGGKREGKRGRETRREMRKVKGRSLETRKDM